MDTTLKTDTNMRIVTNTYSSTEQTIHNTTQTTTKYNTDQYTVRHSASLLHGETGKAE